MKQKKFDPRDWRKTGIGISSVTQMKQKNADRRDWMRTGIGIPNVMSMKQKKPIPYVGGEPESRIPT